MDNNVRKKRTWPKVLLMVLASLIISITAYSVYLSKKAEYAANKAYQALNTKSELREEKVEPLEDNVSILFIGIDDSEQRGQGSENSRSDALLLATLNNNDKTVKMVSIPRDSYVYIPAVEYEDKITHAHAYGGTEATVETVEDLLQVPVDYFVELNFDAFIEIVDALNGIEVEVPYDLIEKDQFDKLTINLTAGMQELNGDEALALARTRHYDNDIERGKRQQMILSAIIDKAASASSFTKYGKVIDAVGDNMKTNMLYSEMKSFFQYIKGGSPYIEKLSIDGYDDMSTGIYYYRLDEVSLESTRSKLKAHLEIADPIETPMVETTTENATD